MRNPEVFISYSHTDEDWKDRLVTHLGVLEQEGLLEIWKTVGSAPAAVGTARFTMPSRARASIERAGESVFFGPCREDAAGSRPVISDFSRPRRRIRFLCLR